MSVSYAQSLETDIHDILSKADLESVSAKTVRKELIRRGSNEDEIRAHKADIDALIAQIFQGLRSEAVEVQPPTHASTTSSRPPQVKRSNSTSSVDGPSHKKPKPSSTASKPLTDEAYARKLQAELDGQSARSSRSGSTSRLKSTSQASPASRKVFKSAAAIIDSDDESSNVGSSPAPKAKKKVQRKSKSTTSESGGNGPENGFNRAMLLSPSLASLLGETHLSRPKTVKALWVYIKEHNLQDPQDKRFIQCDEPMKAVFATDRVHMMSMNKVLSKHLYNPDDVVES